MIDSKIGLQDGVVESAAPPDRDRDAVLQNDL